MWNEHFPGSLPSDGAFPFDEPLARLVGNLPPLPGMRAELAVFETATHLNPTRRDFLNHIDPAPGILHLAGHGFVIESEAGGNWSGLRRSFIADGARRVLAAQWQVRDDDLPGQMKDFHGA